MNNLDNQYQELLKTILEYGIEKKDRTGTGTKSIFGYTIRHNMSEGFPLLTTKRMGIKTLSTELKWFLKGDTNIKYLVDNNCHIWDGDCYKAYIKRYNKGEYVGKTKLLENSKKNRTLTEPFTQEEFINKIKTDDEFAKTWGELGPIYGKQWRQWQKYNGYHLDEPIDQISNLINELKTNPDSRRLMVNAWNVSELDKMVLPPCHHSFQLYSVEKEGQRYLSLLWNQRSIDSALGLPFNIASYGLLLEMIAREVNMIPEHLIGHLGDCHLYSDHLEGAKEQINREPRELPRLHMSSGHNFRAALAGKADEIDLNDFMLIGYDPHPTIKFPLSN
jgi:thymidylate synthase